jgi:hypothetical protein
MENKIKFPKQVGSVKRTKKVLGVDAELFLPTKDEEMTIPPLTIHSGFSRFVLSLIDKDQDIVPTANIPADDIFYVKERTEIAMNKVVDAQYFRKHVATTAAPKSIAYTQKILADKNFKGMTPAEILINTPENKELLIRTRDWLAANVSKYPNNQKQIDAINEALDLFDTGSLNSDTVVESSDDCECTMMVYDSGLKFKSKKNDKGYNLVYNISITCEPTKDYPFNVTIMNCYAPVESLSSGQKTIKLNQAVDTIKASLVMKDMEWYTLLARISATLYNFEAMHFEEQYRKAMENSYKHD